MGYLLGVDSGGTFIKAGIYDETGREIAIARRNVVVSSRHPGWAERDMELLYADACRVIKEVVTAFGKPATEILGMAISAQGKGLYPLDADKKPIRDGILSSDQRALDIVRKWEKDGTAAKIYPDSLHTIWTGHPVALLRWLKEHERANYDRIRYILMSHDYLRYRLTGEMGCEITNISESDLYNMRTGKYDKSLADALGISEAYDWLPRVVGAAEVAGKITPDAAAATGLAVGTPVTGGLFDVVSTCLCAGIVDDSRLNAVLGTWSITTGITDKLGGRGPDGHPFTYGQHAEKGFIQTHEGSPTSAGNLDWFAPYFGVNGKIDYEQMNREATSLPKGEGQLLFLPFLYGTNAGLGMKSGFYGLQTFHERPHLVQAIYEGVIFCHYTHIRRMREQFKNVVALRATGGPTRARAWTQLLADVTGLLVEVPEVDETGCLGSAMAAAVGAGVYPNFSTAIARFKFPLKTVEPDRKAFDAYQTKYGRYQDLIAALRKFEGID